MITPVQIFRALEIFGVLIPHTLNRELIGTRSRSLRYLSYLNPFSFRKDNEKRGPEIRKALEKLGPIYVKFGQLLSTRSDLIPADVIVELEKLQDRVTPFPNDIAIQLIENAFNQPTSELFASFEDNPLASASVAQVHAATLKTGEEVVVKIIRPTIEKTIKHDIAVLKLVANLVERFWKHGKRLRPLALVSEFEKTIFDELDLMREAANASQLKRNFDDSEIMYVPQVYWSYTCENIMTMERIYGVQISDHEAFEKTGTNLKKLAEHGVEIFFTQVFRDAFFHADMHPGNLFVDITDPDNPKYLGVDFGIMGTLSPEDQYYLADNILAFLTRDYRRIAELHIEYGWVAANTRVDEFESAIRTVAEPIFQKPLAEISFGQLLLKLFQTAERFHMVVQPQLFLLQKTLFYIESLGRKLYPNLDLWETAKPFMTKWMRQQRGLRTLAQSAFKDWRMNTENLLKMPNLAFDVLQEIHTRQKQNLPVESKQPKKSNNKRLFLLGAGVALLGSALLLFTHFISHQSPIDLLGVGVGFISLAWLLPN